MSLHHQNLARGRWLELSLAEQLGNIGSEYERALKWRRQNDTRFQNAFDRFLELLDLTIISPKLTFHRKREFLRLREVACSELTLMTNNSANLSNYFYHFAVLARRAV